MSVLFIKSINVCIMSALHVSDIKLSVVALQTSDAKFFAFALQLGRLVFDIWLAPFSLCVLLTGGSLSWRTTSSLRLHVGNWVADARRHICISI